MDVTFFADLIMLIYEEKMIRDYLLEGLKVITIILVVITLISFFFFTRNGLVTRKTLMVSYICFLLSVISGWFTGILYNPSPSTALTSALCLGSITFIFSLFWVFKYFSLPYIEKKVEKKINKKAS